MHFIRNILTLGLLFTMSNISSSPAKVGRKTPSPDGVESAGPYYNPASKSYFELFRMIHSSQQHIWKNANANAQKKFFKNTQGRLAIIRDLATHQFILHNFKAVNYWIGLQYFCGSRSLKWVDGTDATHSKFSAWDTEWSNTWIRCGEMGYMPVHYTTVTTTHALRWRASGSGKYYGLYLVEYPTGKK